MSSHKGGKAELLPDEQLYKSLAIPLPDDPATLFPVQFAGPRSRLFITGVTRTRHRSADYVSITRCRRRSQVPARTRRRSGGRPAVCGRVPVAAAEAEDVDLASLSG